MSNQVKYAFKGKIYFNGASYGSPTWNLVDAVKDVKVGASFDEFDASTRQGGGIKQSEPVLLGLDITGMIRTDETDTSGFVALETAFLTRAAIDIMVLDGGSTVNGSRGYRFDAKNFKFGQDESLSNILYREFELKPCVSANAAYKVVVAAGVPVFTSLAV
jgi:hypothetical protein